MKKSFFSKLLAVAAMSSLLIAAGCSADSSGGGDESPSSEPDTASTTVTVSAVTISGSSTIGGNGGSYTAVVTGENLEDATITYKWEVSSGSSYVHFADESANPAVLKVDSQASEAQIVKIKVTASCGDSSVVSDEFSVTLAAKGETVNDEITAVKASASSTSAESGASVILTAAASANGNPEISYSWEITDGESYGELSSDSGESVTLTLKNSTSSSQNVTVKLSASDGARTKEDSVTVTVNAGSSSGNDEDTSKTGSVSVTVNVDGTVSCAKCGKTYYFKSQAENCGHYKCETCGSVYYSESELNACSSHVTVIFKDSDENGNETVTKVIKSGNTVVPPSWEKENFALTWIDENGNEADFDDTISLSDGETEKTVTFTAKWSTTHTVIFKDESGTNADVTVEVISGETVESIPSWTREHFVLIGWASIVEGLTVDSAVTSDVIFTANWTEDAKYTVKFVDSDGENAEETQTVYEGEKAVAPAWTKENYSLSWTSSVDGITADSAITSDVTFTANWIELPKCSNCGTHYDTEEEANNCSKQEGCPKYGIKTIIALVDSDGNVISGNSNVTVTGSVNAKESNGAVTIDYEGVTYKTVKFDSKASAVVTATAGQKITVVGSLPSGKQKCFIVTDASGKETTYKLDSKTTEITTYVQSFTSTGSDTIKKADTSSIALIIIE